MILRAMLRGCVMRLRFAFALVCAVASLPPVALAHAAENPPLCDYSVTLLDPEAHSLAVTVECRRLVPGFRFADDFPVPFVSGFADTKGTTLNRDGATWRAESGAITAARYTLDLDGMAKAEDDYD